MIVEHNTKNIETGDIVVEMESPDDPLLIVFTNGYWSTYHLKRNCIIHERMSYDDVKEGFRIICKSDNCKIILN